MDKLMEKHRTIYICEGLGVNKSDSIQFHANITAEIAIGFAEWLEKGYWCKSTDTRFPQSYGLWYNTTSPDIDRKECKMTEELFTIYINQL